MDTRELINYGLGIIGILLTVYYFYKSKEGKEPVIFYLTFQDIKKINEENSKIKLFYNRIEVQQVFTTYLWIWNRGRRPINKSDIPSQAPINIGIKDHNEDVKILDWKSLKTSRESINLNVSRVNDTTLNLNFDFLDHNDGAAIEIQHTGDINSEVYIDGVILGSPEGVKRIKARIEFIIFGMRINFSRYDNKNRKFIKPRSTKKFIFVTIMSAVFLGVWIGIYQIQKGGNSEAISTIFSSAFSGVVAGAVLSLIPNLGQILEIFIDYPFPKSLYLDN